MADRVHPRTETKPLSRPQSPPPRDSNEKPVPPPGTYVIQIPKDQVYRVPPPENATRYQSYTRRHRQSRRSSCRCCFCWLCGLLAALILLAAASAVVFYLVVRPESPHYSVQSISFKGFNLTAASPSSAISPDIQVAVRSENPNRKIGIYYERGSSVKLFFSDIKLCDGILPAFYQPSKNVTEFQTALTGSGIKLTSGVQQGLVNAQKQGKVPLDLVIRAPVRIKLGSFKTWAITVRVDCHLTVDKLTADANIMSKDCDYSVHPW